MRNIFLLFLCLVPLFLLSQSGRAIEKPENRGNALFIHFGYGLHGAAGDLQDRFGKANSLMLGVEYMTATNLFVGAQTHAFFGKIVKEDPVAILRNSEGNIIGNNRGLAQFVLRQRGWHFGGYLGKIFVLGKGRSGIRASAGAGVMQHYIRVQDDGNSINQITGNYGKGYDRLTGGFATTQFIGYQHVPLRSGLTWFMGLELEQGFTKSWRDWDFSTKMKLEGNRTDLRYGFRAGFSLPFHFVKKTEEIYY